MKKKSSNYLSGAAILSAAIILTKVIGVFFKIPLNAIIGDYGMGLYAYPYSIYSTFLTISTAGLPVAVSKMVAESLTKDNYKQVYKIFRIAFVTLSALGICASLAMYFGANFFIRIFGWDPNTLYSIRALAFAPFVVCLVSVVRGFFQGMQNLTYSSISQIIEQLGRVGIGILLAKHLTDLYGVQYGAAGATFGAVAGAIAAFIFMYLEYAIHKNHSAPLLAQQPDDIYVEDTKTLAKALIKIAIPVTIGGVVTTLMDLINSATISKCLQTAGFTLSEATALYGRLSQKAQTIVNVPLAIGTAMAASLVPSISNTLALNDKELAKTRATYAIRVGLVFSIPAAIGLSTLAVPIVRLLFSKSPEGGELLQYLSFVCIFNIGMATMQGILQGSGHFYMPIKNILIGAVIKYTMNMLLVSNPQIGIYGAIMSTIAASAVIFTLNLIDVKRTLGLNNFIVPVLKTAVCAAVMGVFCKLFYPLLAAHISYKLALGATIILAVAVYAALMIITKAFTKEELREAKK